MTQGEGIGGCGQADNLGDVVYLHMAGKVNAIGIDTETLDDSERAYQLVVEFLSQALSADIARIKPAKVVSFNGQDQVEVLITILTVSLWRPVHLHTVVHMDVCSNLGVL